MLLLSLQDMRRTLGHSTKGEVENVLGTYEDVHRLTPAGGWQFYLGYSNLKPASLYLVCRRLQIMNLTFILEPRRFHPVPAGKIRSVLDEVTELLTRCSAFLFLAQGPDDWSPLLSWQCGFMEGRGRPVGILPVLTKDTMEDSFHGNGLLGAYPYAASAKTMDEGRETLWMVRTPKDYVNVEYWVRKGF